MRADGPEGASGDARRVLMVADAVGGVWSYALDLASTLRGRRVEVALAVLGPPPSPAQLAAAASVCTVAVKPCRLEWMADPWQDVRTSGEWLLDLERRLRPDVVHLNGYCHAALPWRAPTLVVAHSCVCSWWRAVYGVDAPAEYDRYRDAVARGLAAANAVVAPSAAMAAALEREYHGIRAVRVIPNGRPLRPAVPRGRKQPFVFSAGRIWDAAKNIDALAIVAASLPWPVYAAGNDISPDGRRASHDAMRHLGQLEAHEMEEWFARAAIYALPAKYEPFGLSVLDAALAGCALVLGDIPSLRENWNEAAVFVPSDDRRALEGALRTLIDSPNDRLRFGALARARAARFSARATTNGYAAAYRDVMNHARRGAARPADAAPAASHSGWRGERDGTAAPAVT